MEPLNTDRLIVRFAQPDDAEAIYAYRSNFLENKYQGWFPDSVDEVRDHINNMPQTLDVTGIWFQFAIINTDENRLIGDIGVNISVSDKRLTEIGCTLHTGYQGNGYATEGLGAMINFLFLTLKKHRITASIDPKNTASIRMVERLGFRKEAHFRESLFLHGEWVDDAIYAILRKEWLDNKEKTQ